MTQFTTDIMQALVEKEDISEVFRKHLVTAVNMLLQTELTVFLDYEKYDRSGFNSGNSRNGAYTRTLHTEYGNLALSMPRDRNGEFNQQTVALYKRSNDTLESFVIHMFQKGVTMSEIADLIEKMYVHHYTPQTISNMTKAMSEQVEAVKARPLDACYVCVYLDATYISLKHDTVSKEADYIAVGIPGGRFERSASLYSGTYGIRIRLGRGTSVYHPWLERHHRSYLRGLSRR